MSNPFEELNDQLLAASVKLQNAVGPMDVRVNRVEYVDGFLAASLTCKGDNFLLSHPVPDLANVDAAITQIQDAVRQYLHPKPLLVKH